MANKTLYANMERSPAWEHAATRAAILDAARRMAECDGIPEISLTRVAAEAGFAPASVYAYFANKNDLLLAVVADDLAALARAMRGSLARGDVDKRTARTETSCASLASAADSPARPSRAFPALHLRALPEAMASTGQTEQSGTRLEGPGSSQDRPADPGLGEVGSRSHKFVEEVEPDQENHRLDASVPTPEGHKAPPIPPFVRDGRLPPRDWDDSVITNLRESIARLETRPGDPWLERRLREFERGLVALVERQEQIERTNAAVPSGSTENSLRILRLRLDAMEQRERDAGESTLRLVGSRVDASEQRLRQALSDSEARLVDVTRRLVALENATFVASPQVFRGFAVETPQTPVPEDPIPPEEEPAVPSQETQGQTSDAEQGLTESYLAVARRSARAAALNQQNPEATASLGVKLTRKVGARRALYAAVGCLILFSLLLGAGIFLRARETEPMQHVAVLPRSAPLHRTLEQHPAARLVAAKPAISQSSTQTHLLALAQGGNSKAELLVGLEYLDSAGTGRNPELGAQWLTRAAAHGQPMAQYRLGKLYQDGDGVRADASQAFRWYRSAAVQGNRKSMHNLAVAYAEGWGTPKNLPEAAQWFSRAATLGYLNSEFNLAVLSERGLGTPQSLTEAYKWYALAAAQGDTESQARIAALKTQLNPAAVAAAQKEADNFVAQQPSPTANFAPQFSELPGG